MFQPGLTWPACAGVALCCPVACLDGTHLRPTLRWPAHALLPMLHAAWQPHLGCPSGTDACCVSWLLTSARHPDPVLTHATGSSQTCCPPCERMQEGDDKAQEAAVVPLLHEALRFAAEGVAVHRSPNCLSLCDTLINILVGRRGGCWARCNTLLLLGLPSMQGTGRHDHPASAGSVWRIALQQPRCEGCSFCRPLHAIMRLLISSRPACDACSHTRAAGGVGEASGVAPRQEGGPYFWLGGPIRRVSPH